MEGWSMASTLIHNQLLGHGRRISRREFFQTVGVVVAGTVLVSVGINQLGSTSTTLAATTSLVRSAFAAHVGDMFRIQAATGGSTALQLFKARDLRSAQSLLAQGRSVNPEHTFSLLFRGPVDQPLGQETYRFS